MKKVKQSFTLIEILVVIVIIGILSSFIFFTINDSVEKAQIAKSKMFAESIRNNLLLNLVSEWNFDNESGTTVLDSWGKNNGTNDGATFILDESQCVSGDCVSFDGLNDNILINNSSTLNFKTEDVSISLFVKINPNCSETVFISKGEASGRFWIDYSNNIIRINSYFGTGKDYWKDGTININDNKWHHIAVIFNRDGYEKLYINGVFDTERDMSDAVLNNWDAISPFKISSGIYSFFNGSIDEVQIYNATISESQIKQTYLSGLNNLYSKGLISDIEYNEKINNLSKK